MTSPPPFPGSLSVGRASCCPFVVSSESRLCHFYPVHGQLGSHAACSILHASANGEHARRINVVTGPIQLHAHLLQCFAIHEAW